MLKKTFFSLILLILLPFLLSACGSGKVQGRQAPEVLLARDCGFDKLMCCQEEPACSYGQQCCTDPNSPAKNYCADDCSCGDEEEFCCAGNICQGELACLGGFCQVCGQAGQTCCPTEEKCGAGLVCRDDQCKICGRAGNPCCSIGDPCDKNLSAECREGLCVKCGSNGNPTCAGGKCAKGHINVSGRCETCGGSNQPCCAKTASLGYDCDPAKKLTCELGFCASIK
jgi:hypothetical protein